MKRSLAFWAFPCALGLCASIGRAVEVEDGSASLGLNAGLGVPEGGAAKALGQAAVLGGQFFYYPQGEAGIGLQVDHFNHKSKAGNRAGLTSVLLTGRANIEIKSDSYLPYLLAGLGYAESGAELAGGGHDRGSGAGLCIGAGVERFLTRRASLGAEFRVSRLAAGLPRLGLSGATIASAVLRLNVWLGAQSSPFRK